jgi:hypothetical protein
MKLAAKQVTPTAQYQALCPFQHLWVVSAHVVNRGQVRSEGRRVRTLFETVVSAPLCPTCGVKWCSLIPKQ